jgi:UTP--glucose-1-phosphate uridylyltransferase
MVSKAVIPVAGLGTRLLTATKEQPKEMLPLFSVDGSTNLCLKPIVQLIFEQLYNNGIREFCFVVGRGKRIIEDHFTPDYDFLEQLKSLGKDQEARNLADFYNKVETCTIYWTNQPRPLGFGHAVLAGESFADNDEFIVHAGDSLVIPLNSRYVNRMINVSNQNAVVPTLVVARVEKPSNYGIVDLADSVAEHPVISDVEEKPANPKSNLAIMPMYLLNKKIFKYLKSIGPGIKNEIQLTDAIRLFIKEGNTMTATFLGKNESCIDIGSPNEYYKALNRSYEHSIGTISEAYQQRVIGTNRAEY